MTTSDGSACSSRMLQWLKNFIVALMYSRLVISVVLTTAALVGCSDPVVVPDPFPTAYDGARFDTDLLATTWYDCATECIEKHPSFADPIAARVYAYMGIALYQSLVWGMPGYRSLEGQIAGLSVLPTPDTAGKRFYWALVANSAMAEVLRGLLPSTSPAVIRRIDSLESANIEERWLANRDTGMLRRSVAYGKELARRILDIARSDGGDAAWMNLFPPDYQLPPMPGVWKPTSPVLSPVPLLPQWASVRMLACNDTSAPSPPEYATAPSSAFYAAADSVRRRMERATELELDGARYWADPFGQAPTFPGHLIRIATQLVRSGPYRMGFGAVLYLRLGLAMHDGYVVAWKAKYRYPLLRPQTYIAAYLDSRYRALIEPPPTPEYISDRVLVATAVVRILQQGFDMAFPQFERITDRTHQQRGLLPRDYRTLDALLADIIAAERWSGTQYDFSIAAGASLGERIAGDIFDRIRIQ
ncbi:MAG: hypothetical protein N2663_07480 [Chlorobi bacterium]|nr:hypothetical protein [Chlorobiota bacterium]